MPTGRSEVAGKPNMHALRFQETMREDNAVGSTFSLTGRYFAVIELSEDRQFSVAFSRYLGEEKVAYGHFRGRNL